MPRRASLVPWPLGKGGRTPHPPRPGCAPERFTRHRSTCASAHGSKAIAIRSVMLQESASHMPTRSVRCCDLPHLQVWNFRHRCGRLAPATRRRPPQLIGQFLGSVVAYLAAATCDARSTSPCPHREAVGMSRKCEHLTSSKRMSKGCHFPQVRHSGLHPVAARVTRSHFKRGRQQEPLRTVSYSSG